MATFADPELPTGDHHEFYTYCQIAERISLKTPNFIEVVTGALFKKLSHI